MKNLQVTKKRTAVVEFTVDQWQLFRAVAGAREAAIMLNHTLSAVVGQGFGRVDTERRMYACMAKYARWGADGIEPHVFLQAVLDEIYA